MFITHTNSVYAEKITLIHDIKYPQYVHQITDGGMAVARGDRKSTRLNSSHTVISYAVFCLKKKNKKKKKKKIKKKKKNNQLHN